MPSNQAIKSEACVQFTSSVLAKCQPCAFVHGKVESIARPPRCPRGKDTHAESTSPWLRLRRTSRALRVRGSCGREGTHASSIPLRATDSWLTWPARPRVCDALTHLHLIASTTHAWHRHDGHKGPGRAPAGAVSVALGAVRACALQRPRASPPRRPPPRPTRRVVGARSRDEGAPSVATDAFWSKL